MKSNLKEMTKAKAVMKKWGNTLSVDSRKGITIIHHIDGSHFTFFNSAAKAIDIGDYKFVMIITEYCGSHIFFRHELRSWVYCKEYPTVF